MSNEFKEKDKQIVKIKTHINELRNEKDEDTIHRTILLHLTYHPKDISRNRMQEIYEIIYENTFKDLLNSNRIVLLYHISDSLRSFMLLSNLKDYVGENNIKEYYQKTSSMLESDNKVDINTTIKSITEEIRQEFYLEINHLNQIFSSFR